MMEVIRLGLAVTPSAKAAAYRQLAVLTRSVATNVAWRQLNQHTFVKIMQKFAGQFGQRLTKKKLGQFVLVAGIGIGAALNWKMVGDVSKAAYWVYRERFLHGKGADSPPIVIDAEGDDDLSDGAYEDTIDVLGILETEGIALEADAQADDGEGSTMSSVD